MIDNRPQVIDANAMSRLRALIEPGNLVVSHGCAAEPRQQWRANVQRAGSAPLLHFEAEVVFFQDAALSKRQLRKDLIVIGDCLNFGRARGRQGFLKLKHKEGCG